MKREDLVSLIVYALMIVGAVLVGIYVIGNIFNNLSGVGRGARIGISFGFVIVAIIINSILIELGHLIGARVGKYHILSINILGFCFYRKDGKTKFKFKNFDGLTGETKISPKDEKSNPKAFAIWPLIMYALELALCMVLFIMFANMAAETKNNGYYLIQIAAIMFITIGGMIELYNIFPAKLDSLTDGYRLVVLSKKENKDAYNELMKIDYLTTNNLPLDNIKVFDNITDFTVDVNLFTVYKYLDSKQYDEAEKLLDKMIEAKSKININTYCSVLSHKLYILLMNKTYEEVKPYYDAHVSMQEKRVISNSLGMESIRAYILISSILDISEQETRFATSRYNKALKLLNPSRVEIEKKLYELALDKVDQVRPEWHIKDKQII